MKFLLVLLALVFGVWLWRKSRIEDKATPRSPPPPPAQATDTPQEMGCCAWCQVHLPRSDMVSGQGALYCCEEHRQRAES